MTLHKTHPYSYSCTIFGAAMTLWPLWTWLLGHTRWPCPRNTTNATVALHLVPLCLYDPWEHDYWATPDDLAQNTTATATLYLVLLWPLWVTGLVNMIIGIVMWQKHLLNSFCISLSLFWQFISVIKLGKLLQLVVDLEIIWQVSNVIYISPDENKYVITESSDHLYNFGSCLIASLNWCFHVSFIFSTKMCRRIDFSVEFVSNKITSFLSKCLLFNNFHFIIFKISC